jgi:methylenetetrahydrofolate/methylenetetrahydromethanopterin dehydrogenase (NADP+)
MIDLNGVPPTGIEGVELMDAGVVHDGVLAYGALGVGGTKMKIHRAAVAALFERNDAVLDIDEIYDIALKVQ